MGAAMEARGTAPGRQGGTRRAWLWALAASVGLHVVVLSALLTTRLPTVRLPTGAAPAEAKRTLFKVGVQSRPKEVAGAPLAAADEATKPGGARTKEASPAPPVPALEQASPDLAPGGEAPPPAESGEGVAESPTAQSSPGGQGVPSGEGASGPVAAPGAAAAEATGGAGLEVAAQVHARLAAAAERCYPASARRYQQRGTVEVRFCVDGQGAARDAQVLRTSGAGLLDAAVGDCVLPAAAPLPEVARGRCFTVPVRFGLR